jgi:acyl-CoA reductase-like NAD-dependent aldehyde dehydrogenase
MSVAAFNVISPVDEKIVKTVRFADRAELDARVDRAHRAFAAWRQVAPGDRARLLRRFAEAVDGDIETLAALEVRNAGHTIGNARWEAGNVRDVLNYYSAAPERLAGSQIPVPGGIDVTFHEPLGVARAWDSGNLSVNAHSSVRYWTPVGGFKQSGLGRELGPDAVSAFTETKNVFISTEE